MRDIDDAKAGFVYRGHNSTATVAKFSPSGCWVASADITGKVRVWAWDNPEHSLKVSCLLESRAAMHVELAQLLALTTCTPSVHTDLLYLPVLYAYALLLAVD